MLTVITMEKRECVLPSPANRRSSHPIISRNRYRSLPTPSDQAPIHPPLLAFELSFQDMEKRTLEEALHKTSGNVSEASRLLKMTRNTLRYRMAKHHIQ